jgi:hypothetical protein
MVGISSWKLVIMAKPLQAYFAIKIQAIPVQVYYRARGFQEAEGPRFPKIGM